MPDAEYLRRFRPITLLCQTHKLFLKWLVGEIRLAVEQLLSEEQLGYRGGRQAVEASFSVLKATEVAREWQRPLVVIKIDVQKVSIAYTV